MFDIGFSELVLTGIVALVIFGPEELPRVARTAGHLLGRLRRYVADVKSDISREMEASEMKNLVADVQESARVFQNSVHEQATSFKASFDGLASVPEEIQAALQEPAQVSVPSGLTSENTASTPDALPEVLVKAETVQVPAPGHIVESLPPAVAETDLFTHADSADENTTANEDDGQLDLFGEPIHKPVKKD